MLNSGGSIKNFPLLAKKTFDRFSNDSSMMKIAKKVLKGLRKLKGAARRARFVHRFVDSFMEEIFENPVAKSEISCEAGCAHCCATS